MNGHLVPEEEDFPFRAPVDSNRKIGVVKIKVKECRKIRLGDKLTGRHGNKGVIGAIVPEEEMPRLPDGTPVEVILNPNGVISRMNLGQLLEIHYSFLYKYRFEINAKGGELFGKDEIEHIENAGKAFQENDPEKLSTLLKKLLDNLFPNEIKDYHSFGKVFLTDPITGKTYGNPSAIGYQYLYKLNHLADLKIAARGQGTEMEYDQITHQPTKGKKKNGGQRVGEMEFAALLAHNVPEITNEFLNEKSEYKHDQKMEGIPQATKAFFHYLHGMGLHPTISDIDGSKKLSIEVLTEEKLLGELSAKEIQKGR